MKQITKKKVFKTGGNIPEGDTKGQAFWEQVLLQKQKELSPDNPNMKFDPIKYAKKQEQAGKAFEMLGKYYPESAVYKAQLEVAKKAGENVGKTGVRKALLGFAMGGSITGGGEEKGRPPIYVSDPNDPRLKAYSDSLSLYKEGLNPFLQFMQPPYNYTASEYKPSKTWGYRNVDSKFIKGELKNIDIELTDYSTFLDANEIKNLRDRKALLTKSLSTGVYPTNMIYPETYTGALIYKKPVQPVALAKTYGDITKLPTAKINPKESSSTPAIKTKPTATNPTYPYFSTPTVNVEGSHDVYGYDPDARQWNLIDVVSPEEAKTIYNAIGQKDIKSMRETMKKITPSAKFDMGGAIGSAVGTALQFVPGVGPILSKIATPLLQAAGSAIDKSDAAPDKVAINSPVAKTINPFGNYKFGGPIFADGGSLDPKSVYDYLISKGLTKEHALGMLANIKSESGFNAGAVGDNGTSGGLFQHHATRFDALKKYAGDNWSSDWQKQIDYALTEKDTKNYLAQSFATPEEATAWFTKNWERPANADAKAAERVKNLEHFTFTSEVPADTLAPMITDINPTVATESTGTTLQAYQNYVTPNATATVNRFAKKQYGGPINPNMVITSGGQFEDFGSNILYAKGKSHDEGGIKIDTKGMQGFDGLANIEVEHGELISKEGYVIPADKAKPFVGMFKRLAERKDSVSDNTRKLIFSDLAKKTEADLIAKGKSAMPTAMPQMASGGTFNLPQSTLDMLRYATMPVTDLNGMTQPAYEYYNSPGRKMAGSLEYQISNSSSPSDDNPQIFPSTNSTTSTTTTPNIAPTGNSMASGLVQSGFGSYLSGKSEAPGTTYSKGGNTGSSDFKTPSGDIAQLVGMGVTTAYNLGRGLFDKAEQYTPDYNEYEDQYANLKQSINLEPMRNAARQQFSTGLSRINNSTSSAGTRLGNVQNLYGNFNQNMNELEMKSQEMNNRYAAEQSSRMYSVGASRQAARAVTDQANWANQVAKDQYISEGISNLSQGLTEFGKQRNSQASNELGVRILNDAFPDYYWNTDIINNIVSGQKPSWMTQDDFAKAKLLLYKKGYNVKLD